MWRYHGPYTAEKKFFFLFPFLESSKSSLQKKRNKLLVTVKNYNKLILKKNWKFELTSPHAFHGVAKVRTAKKKSLNSQTNFEPCVSASFFNEHTNILVLQSLLVQTPIGVLHTHIHSPIELEEHRERERLTICKVISCESSNY